MSLGLWCCPLIAFLPLAVLGQDQKAPALADGQFRKLHTLIKPQPGELRFQQIPWLLDVWEARKKAAAEGKPILVWSGAGGAPIGVC
jgi:hypothetical protein